MWSLSPRPDAFDRAPALDSHSHVEREAALSRAPDRVEVSPETISGKCEAKEILYGLDRIPRALWQYEDLARVHLSLSGSLLETLANPNFQHRAYRIVDCGSLLWYLQNTRVIEVLGTGYFHPVLPLIRPTDREEHLHRRRPDRLREEKPAQT